MSRTHEGYHQGQSKLALNATGRPITDKEAGRYVECLDAQEVSGRLIAYGAGFRVSESIDVRLQ